MKALSNFGNTMIISAAILLVGNILNSSLSALAAATMGFAATSRPNAQTVLFFCLSGVLFALGTGLAIASIALEKKREK